MSNTTRHPPPERVRELLDRFTQQHILVAGDLMLDRFIYGHVNRISPEAPVPIVKVLRETDMPGGACNVARNIRSLGGQSSLCGFVGQDEQGRALLELLRNEGVCADAVMVVDNYPTTVKTRIIAEHQQVVRVDWDHAGTYPPDIMGAFCDQVARHMKSATGVVIEDYGKGVVAQDVVDRVIAEAQRLCIPSGLDPKDNHELDIRGITVATPNRGEAYAVMRTREAEPHADPTADPNLLGVAVGLLKRWAPDFLMITLGAQGVMLVEPDQSPRHIPTRAREVFDVSGAGDTFIAVCLLALAAGATHDEAAELANYAAGVVVGKLGTAVCSAEELYACFIP